MRIILLNKKNGTSAHGVLGNKKKEFNVKCSDIILWKQNPVDGNVGQRFNRRLMH